MFPAEGGCTDRKTLRTSEISFGAVGWDTRYKPEGRTFDSRWSLQIFHWHNPSGRTTALGSTEPLTETSTTNISSGQRWPVRMADNLTTFMYRLSWYLGVSASCNPRGLSRDSFIFSTFAYVMNTVLGPPTIKSFFSKLAGFLSREY